MGRGRILVIDDDVEVGYACQSLLSKDYDVLVVKSGEEAMASWERQTFDLVLLDLKLPKVSGVDILKWMKQSHAECPVITMSGVVSFDDAVMQTARLGAAKHLGKPFGMAALINGVKEGLAKQKADKSLSGKKILLVDDDLEMLQYLRMILTAKGAVVIAASSGAQALELIRKEEPHLVLLDFQLPDRPGLEVCATIKGDKTLKTQIPVAILTASLGPEFRIKAQEAGADHFLVKPVTHFELDDALKRLLPR